MDSGEAQNLLRLLEDTARGLGVQIRYEDLSGDEEIGGTRGGLCRLRGADLILIERQLSPVEKCALVAEALGSFDLSRVFVPPLVRQAVDRAAAKR